MDTTWKEKRVLILGAARQGLSSARYLSNLGAIVTVNDKNSLEKMRETIQPLEELPIRWVFNEHPIELIDQTDMLVISGGIPLDLPIVREALARKIPITNDSQIFMEAVPCKVVGITGSAGKTTTTTLLGNIAKEAIIPPRNVWVGGNIGVPLLDHLDKIQPDDLVIMELSSFQLDQMTISPNVAAVLNITPNHLDRHGTLASYTSAKARILDYQKPGDVAVLSRDDSGSWGLRSHMKGQLVTFGMDAPPPGTAGTHLKNGCIYYTDGKSDDFITSQDIVQLRGRHNLLNVLSACAIAQILGFESEKIEQGIQGFSGVPHRLEWVRTWEGTEWYNDSIATTPERTLAAIRSFTEPLVLLLGGRDKDLPWEDLGYAIQGRVDHVIVFGEAAGKIREALTLSSQSEPTYTLDLCTGLQQAVLKAVERAKPGDIVLLSPGGTSFDEFHDFEERGERYSKWVKQLE